MQASGLGADKAYASLQAWNPMMDGCFGFVPAEVGRLARANMLPLYVFSRSDRLEVDASSLFRFMGLGWGKEAGG